jgi:hypothetical protein
MSIVVNDEFRPLWRSVKKLGAFFREESTTVQSHEVAAFGRFRKKAPNFSFGATSR